MFPLCFRHGNHGSSYSATLPGRGPRRRLVLLACLVLAVIGGLTLGACGPVGSTRADAIHTVPAAHAAGVPVLAADQVIDVRASDFAYEAPGVVDAGFVTIRFRNDGAELHHAQVLRLHNGVTPDQVAAAAILGTRDVLQLGTQVGGPAAVAPGGAAEVTLDLVAGLHALVCFIGSPDGVQHAAKGMVQTFEVAWTPDLVGMPKEPTDAVTLSDFMFELPSFVRAGRASFTVVNRGQHPHELAIGRIDDGHTYDDVVRSFYVAQSGPRPYRAVGGMQALAPGASGQMTIDVQPGQYVALCVIREPRSGLSHVRLGMVEQFTVH